VNYEMLFYSVFASVGMISTVYHVVGWWLRSTQGEFHCPTCGSVKPLPKD
jgi:hypothetical protein